MKYRVVVPLQFASQRLLCLLEIDDSAVTTMKHERRMQLRAATKQQNGNSVFLFRQKGYVRNRMRSGHRRLEWDGNRMGKIFQQFKKVRKYFRNLFFLGGNYYFLKVSIGSGEV